MEESKQVIELKKQLLAAEQHVEKVKAELYSTLGRISTLKELIVVLENENKEKEKK